VTFLVEDDLFSLSDSFEITRKVSVSSSFTDFYLQCEGNDRFFAISPTTVFYFLGDGTYSSLTVSGPSLSNSFHMATDEQFAYFLDISGGVFERFCIACDSISLVSAVAYDSNTSSDDAIIGVGDCITLTFAESITAQGVVGSGVKFYDSSGTEVVTDKAMNYDAASPTELDVCITSISATYTYDELFTISITSGSSFEIRDTNKNCLPVEVSTFSISGNFGTKTVLISFLFCF
jgi:hypothetical protein